MKRHTRVFSVVMALVLMLSIVVIPVSAGNPADAHVSFELELQPVVGELDAKGNKSEDNGIYKLIVYVTSDVRLSSILMDVTYDNTKFLPVLGAASGTKLWTRTATQGKLIASNRAGELLDETAYYADGTVETDPSMADFADYWGPSHSSMSAYLSKFEYLKEGAASWTYKPCDKSLEVGQCTHEPMAEIYFKLTAGQSAEGAVFGFGTGVGTSSKSVGFNANPVAGKFHDMATADFTNILPLSAIGTPDYTYTPAAPAGPVVEKTIGQIRMTPTSPTTVAPEFEFRIISSISSQDWIDYFSNTGTDVTDTNCITSVGMVAYTGPKDDYDRATAEAVAKSGASQGAYIYGASTYIHHVDGEAATFGAILKCNSDTLANDPICLGFVNYADGEKAPQTAFYADTYTAPLVTDYNGCVAAYLNANPYQG